VYFPISDVFLSPWLLALLGMIVGTMTGFFGVGGGFLITGGLLVLGVPTIYAVGTGLLMVMGTAITSTLRHRRLGNVDMRLAFLIVCGTVPGGLIAERLNAALHQIGLAGLVIGLVYFVLLLSLGSLMTGNWLYQLRNRRNQPATLRIPQFLHNLRVGPAAIRVPGVGNIPTRTSFPRAGIGDMSVFVPAITGFVIGFIALLLGAGGGFILMPFLVYGLGVPAAVAIGTDLFQIIITGTLGAFLYSLGGNVDPMIAVIMFASASVGTQLGALATRFVDSNRILGLFGVTVLTAGVAVGLRQLAHTLDSAPLAQVGQVLLLGASGLVAVTILGLLAAAVGVRVRRGRRLAMLRKLRAEGSYRTHH
jgi:uncharacterized membrane protein YfcA